MNKELREHVLEELRKLQDTEDWEAAHYKADRLLVKAIDDVEIAAAYNAIGKWYA